MEITEIIKKAIKYPTTNGKGYLLFGILIVLANLKFFTSSMQEHNIFIIGIICSLITFIFYCVMSGYDIFVIKEGIDKSNKFPTFNFIKQFVTLIGIYVYQIYIAALVSFLFVNPFLYLFQSQTVGLLYSETE